MRTTLDLAEELLADATNAVLQDRLARHAGGDLPTKTFVIEEALRALVREHAAHRLAHSFGSEPHASAPPRRRAHE